MRRILELRAELDEFARETYQTMADNCRDPELAVRMRQMARDETDHIRWWTELLEAWDKGLLPDIVNEPEALDRKLSDTLDKMRAEVPPDHECLDPDAMLTVAVKIEFFMLDPSFGELLDLTEPAIAAKRHEEYEEHLGRLIEAIERHFDAESLSAFLARLLRRSWDDNRKLATHAMRDPLTGLYNRRAFDAHLKQWTAWAARYGRPLAVLLVDIDDFKLVNDTRGHIIGDLTLMGIANALADSVRASDLIARYGGDEFAILAPETEVDVIRQLSQRVLDTVRQSRGIDGEGAAVTVSVGSVVTDDIPGGRPRRIEELLAAADQGLYAAKAAGKDRATEPMVLVETVHV